MEKTNLNDGKGRFSHVPSKTPMAMLKVCGIFDESPIDISICPTTKENFINVDLSNQLLVPKSSIVKNKSNEDQINELPLQINDYNFASQFIIAAIDDKLVDIMLGSNWLEILGTFIVNAKRKYMTFFHGKSEITIHYLSLGVPKSQITDEGPTYGNCEDLEEEVKRLNKIIINKDEDIA